MKLTDWTDQKVENIIGTLLRVGVLTSAFVVFFGGAIYLAHHGRSTVDYRIFQGEPADYRHISGIVQEAFHLNGRGVIQLGLLLLIATPIARVIFALFGFAAEKDRMYACVTAIVLVILLYSLLGTV
ncbi:MAG TPA: DUF1634 domain-containing protein [Terriglobales bacterium]|nr:DUF1634 domain-containing protein [Terriglobales bacterium]